MSTRLSEPASLMNTDLSPRCRLTALRSSEGWSWQVTGNPISWQGAVKLTYNAQPIPWRTPPRLGDKDGTPTMRPCGSFPRLPVVIRHWCNSRFTSVPVHPKTYSYSRDSTGEAGQCFLDQSGRKRSLAISLRAHQAHRTRVFRRGAVPFVHRESEVLFVGSPSAFRSSTSKMTAGTSIPTSAKIFACFPAA